MSNLGSQRLQGRVAFVSGGLRGIGLACVERFLAEGAEVVLSDLDAADSALATETMARLGQAASYVQANVTKEEDWARARDTVVARHGKLHILVNNAGIGPSSAIEDTTLAAFRAVMAVNVDGVFLGVKTFAELLGASGNDVAGGSSIINVSSMYGIVGAVDTAPYNASKGAVRLFTKGMALEFATKKVPIRVNSLHPGMIETAMMDNGFQGMVDAGLATSVKDLKDGMIALTPLGRLGQPEDLAAGVYFLASADSAFMTGAELVMDGGWTVQ
ncbi:MAG: SDR family oxidoreductase [Sphingomonadales bacterium]|nr:SDR family oxidoreductase [Sphingomonadales bacterium]